MGERKIMPDQLEAFCTEAIGTFGLREDDARLAAQIFVKVDTWGIFTHGTRQLRNLLPNFPLGRLDAQGHYEIATNGPAWAHIDGHNTMPPVTGHHAMLLAVEKARTYGIGYVSVTHTSHFGAAGYYANLAAEQGLIGLAMCNADPQIAIPGARGKILGTNPIAYAIPAGQYPPVFLDIATSAVAANKVIRAKALGQAIPEGWLVDDEGQPTTDPSVFPEGGALLPMAGHKGYGLGILVEVLSAVLSGAELTNQQASWVPSAVGNTAEPTNQGQMYIAIDPATLMPLEAFKERMDGLIEYFKNAPKAKGSTRVYLPGEMEWERREAALSEGIPLPSDVLDSLQGLANDAGLGALPF